MRRDWGQLLHKTVSRALAAIAVITAALTPALGDDDFPIVGVYTKDEVCRGDGSDRVDLLVKITRKDIQSTLGTCAILNKRREGKRISVHVECKMAGDLVILGDVTFTVRDDRTLDFDDQDHTSPAVLHKCSSSIAAGVSRADGEEPR